MGNVDFVDVSFVQPYICSHKTSHLNKQGLEKVLLSYWWIWDMNLSANLHWGVARSSRARFFVRFLAPRICRAESCTSIELPDATKQNRARLLLATPQCRLAFSLKT